MNYVQVIALGGVNPPQKCENGLKKKKEVTFAYMANDEIKIPLENRRRNREGEGKVTGDEKGLYTLHYVTSVQQRPQEADKREGKCRAD